jgi:hypothetical protein
MPAGVFVAPRVGEPEEEDPDEHQHAQEERAGVEAAVLEYQGPQVDEHDLDVERDEQQRIDIEADAEPGVGVAVRVDA